jgi:transcriptional regulator with GAF, ATPase, and Fis domain
MKAKKKKRKRAPRAARPVHKKRDLFNGHKGAPVVVTVTIGTDDCLPQLTAARRLADIQFERAYLNEVMTRAGGSLAVAGRVAGYDRTNLRRRLKAHKIDPKSFVHDEQEPA